VLLGLNRFGETDTRLGVGEARAPVVKSFEKEARLSAGLGSSGGLTEWVGPEYRMFVQAAESCLETARGPDCIAAPAITLMGRFSAIAKPGLDWTGVNLARSSRVGAFNSALSRHCRAGEGDGANDNCHSQSLSD